MSEPRTASCPTVVTLPDTLPSESSSASGVTVGIDGVTAPTCCVESVLPTILTCTGSSFVANESTWTMMLAGLTTLLQIDPGWATLIFNR